MLCEAPVRLPAAPVISRTRPRIDPRDIGKDYIDTLAGRIELERRLGPVEPLGQASIGPNPGSSPYRRRAMSRAPARSASNPRQFAGSASSECRPAAGAGARARPCERFFSLRTRVRSENSGLSTTKVTRISGSIASTGWRSVSSNSLRTG